MNLNGNQLNQGYWLGPTLATITPTSKAVFEKNKNVLSVTCITRRKIWWVMILFPLFIYLFHLGQIGGKNNFGLSTSDRINRGKAAFPGTPHWHCNVNLHRHRERLIICEMQSIFRKAIFPSNTQITIYCVRLSIQCNNEVELF